MSSAPKKKSGALKWVLIILGVVLLICAVSGAIFVVWCGSQLEGAREAMTSAQTDAEEFRGGLSEACVDEGFRRLAECEMFDMMCSMGPVAFMQSCIPIASDADTFCAERRGNQWCSERCDPNDQRCAYDCGQMLSALSQACAMPR